MKYTIRFGDTLRMIAQRELGDTDRWEEVAVLNDLTYPYISHTSSKGIVSPGDTITLPSEEEFVIRDEPSLGTDLKLTTDRINLSYGRSGDLEVDQTGDYQLVSEFNCLRQDITHRQMTPIGTLPYHQDYGSFIPTIIGSKRDENWRTKARLEMERTLRSDPRITDVRDIQVRDIPTGIGIKYTGVASGIRFTGGGEGNEEI